MRRNTEDALVVAGIGLLLFSALWDASLAAAGSILLLAYALARESMRRARRQ
jgi:hypothetical protein